MGLHGPAKAITSHVTLSAVDAVWLERALLAVGLSDPSKVVADLDQDGDVDEDDLRLFESCVTGPTIPYDPFHLPDGCTLRPDFERRIGADLDRDGDVDQTDLGLFQRCFSGAGIPADPSCNNATTPQITRVLPTDGRLARDSIAFQPSEDMQTLDQYPADNRRIGKLLAVAPSDGELRSKEALVGGGTVDNLIVAAVTGGYIWGYRYGKPTLYVSADGDHWQVAQTFPTGLCGVWAIQDDDHPLVQSLNVVYETNPSVAVSRCRIWYWSGARWTEATYQIQQDGDWVPWFKGVGEPRQATWSLGFTQAPHGTIVVSGAGVSYGGSAAAAIAGHHAQEMWRSVDRGRSWRRVLRWDYALQDGAGNYLWPIITHTHAIGYHAATNRWIVDTGDGSAVDPRTSVTRNRMYWMVSDDDGQTWKDHLTGGPYPVSTSHQVVHWHDFGDPNVLAIASDWQHRISTVSMVTYESCQLLTPRPEFHDNTYPYFAMVTQHGGWWLAFSANSVEKEGDTQGIWVSPDGVHWAVYHEFGLNAGITTVSHFAGEIGGKLHIVTYMRDGSYRHALVSPPRGQLVDAVVVSPAHENLLSDSQSRCDTMGGLSFGPGTTSAMVPVPRMMGTRAMRVARTGGDLSLQLYPVKTEEGKSYRAAMWLRGGGNLEHALIRFPADQPLGQVVVGLPQDRWVRVMSSVWTETAKGGSRRQAKILGYGVTPDEIGLYVDGCEIVETDQAGPWQPGGTPQAAELLTRDIALSVDWTYVLGLYSFGHSDEFAPNTTYEITRFQQGPSDYIRLFYDSTDLKFKLAIRRTGDLAETIAATKPNWFHRGSTFRFIVRHAGDGRVQATLLGAKGVEDFCDLRDGVGIPPLWASQVVAGTSPDQFSGMLFGEQWVNEAWSDTEKDAFINQVVRAGGIFAGL